MYIYSLFLLIPLLASFFFPSRRRGTVLLLWAFFIPLVIFVGLRDGVGPDWPGYQLNYVDFTTVSWEWSEVLRKGEPAYFLLNKLSEEMQWDVHGVMAGCALLFLWGVFAFAAKTVDPWLALAVVMPYLVFVIGMSGVRQAAAIGLGYYMLAHRKDWPLLAQVALIGLATLFHTSAAVFLLFLLFEGKGKLPLRALLVTAVVWYLYNQWSDPESFSRYKTVYVQTKLESTGALYHVLLTVFPAALYILNRRRIEQTVGLDRSAYAASWLALAALPMVFISSTATDRMVLYFSFVQMVTYPALVRAYPTQSRLVKVLVAILALTIFFVFFTLGEHAQYYIPYKNILFD
jgi:EpsG family